MSDSNLTEKISETMSALFKKTKTFERLERIEIYIGTFVVVCSMVGLTSVYINYCGLIKLIKLEEKIEEIDNKAKINIEVNRKYIDNLSMRYNKVIEQNRNDYLILMTTQQKFVEKLTELKMLLDVTIINSPIKPFSPSISIDDCGHNIIEQEEDKSMDDDELINECYDSIPMNNLKKNMGLSWLFTPLKI